MSNSWRAMPDWFDATTTRYPAWFRRAIASSEPGMGIHSSGDLMKSGESWLITPSRSRMMSFCCVSFGCGACGIVSSGSQFRDVGHAIHHAVQRREQRQAVIAQRQVVGHHHHVVEE